MKRNINIALPCTGQEEIEAVKEPLFTGWLTQGPKVKEFERDFCNYHNVKYGLATTSCTTALHLALLSVGVKPGDEVIVPSFTWVATANSVLYCGATPIIVDVKPDTYNIDPIMIKRAITSKTKAIIAVHLFGLTADINEIKNVAPNIPIIEDAACASGAKYYNCYAGGLGDIAAFSFHPRKTITTGEGGMVTSNNKDLITKADILRNHGASLSEEVRHSSPKPYMMADFNDLGFNYRMTDIQAAIGIAQLKKLDSFITERRKWAEFYRQNLESVSWLQTPYEPSGYYHSYQSFVCYFKSDKIHLTRNEVMEKLQQSGISTRAGTHAVHSLGYYKNLFKYSLDYAPVSLDLMNNTIALPLHNKMNPEDYEYVVDVIRLIR